MAKLTKRMKKKEAKKMLLSMRDPRFDELNRVCREIANRNLDVLKEFEFQQYAAWELSWVLEDCARLTANITQFEKDWSRAILELNRALMYKHAHPVRSACVYWKFRIVHLVTNVRVERSIRRANSFSIRQLKKIGQL